jgi:hypothetical protein
MKHKAISVRQLCALARRSMMNTDKTAVTDSHTVASDWRAELSAKQSRVIDIAKERNFPLDVPISDLQYGAPSVNDLSKSIYPDFIASIDSFLAQFDKP